jgi:hypothetical protein
MVAALSVSLPVNATDRTRVLLRLDEATRNDAVSARPATRRGAGIRVQRLETP